MNCYRRDQFGPLTARSGRLLRMDQPATGRVLVDVATRTDRSTLAARCRGRLAGNLGAGADRSCALPGVGLTFRRSGALISVVEFMDAVARRGRVGEVFKGAQCRGRSTARRGGVVR